MVVGYGAFLSWVEQQHVFLETEFTKPIGGLATYGLELLVSHDPVPTQLVTVFEDDIALCYGLGITEPEKLGQHMLILQANDPKEYGHYPILARLERHNKKLHLTYSDAGIWLVDQGLERDPPVRRPPVQYTFAFEDVA
jgi:hypothetical protein